MPFGDEFFAEFDVIIYFSVENHHVAFVGGEHGLMPCGTQVENTQAHEAEAHPVFGK